MQPQMRPHEARKPAPRKALRAMFIEEPEEKQPVVTGTHLVLAANVRTIRHFRDLTQEQLAERSGISLAMIQHIENRRRVPRGALLDRLAAALEVPIARLFAPIDLPMLPKEPPVGDIARVVTTALAGYFQQAAKRGRPKRWA